MVAYNRAPPTQVAAPVITGDAREPLRRIGSKFASMTDSVTLLSAIVSKRRSFSFSQPS